MIGPFLCVRCGAEPRHRYTLGEEGYLCWSCLANPGVRAEVLTAQRMESTTAGRAWLVTERGWRGGWAARVPA